MRLVLASRSPARLATLRTAGIDPIVVVSHVDESRYDDPDPRGLTVRLAEAKATAVLGRPEVVGADLILGCDSVLSFGGMTLGKPRDAADAADRWRAMRGKQGILITGHHLISAAARRSASAAVETVVHFADVSDAEIEAYVASNEPRQVAGGFTIDGLGAAFVTRLEGDHHNVVGLSLPALRDLVTQLGWFWPDLWQRPI